MLPWAALRCRYAADARLREQLAGVGSAHALRALLKQLCEEGRLDEVAELFRKEAVAPAPGVVAQQPAAPLAAQQRAAAPGGGDHGRGALGVPRTTPPPGVTGVKHLNGQWHATLSLQQGTQGGGPASAAVFCHPDFAVAAAALDLAVYWKTAVLGQRHHLQQPAVLHARCGCLPPPPTPEA